MYECTICTTVGYYRAAATTGTTTELCSATLPATCQYYQINQVTLYYLCSTTCTVNPPTGNRSNSGLECIAVCYAGNGLPYYNHTTGGCQATCPFFTYSNSNFTVTTGVNELWCVESCTFTYGSDSATQFASVTTGNCTTVAPVNAA